MDGISLISVSKSYEMENQSIEVLRNVNLNLDSNRITVVLGRSGCGKTTLLKIISGLEGFDSGEILGIDNKQKAYVFQEHRLMPWLNVEKNIMFGIKNKNKYSSYIDEVIDIVGLNEFRHAHLNQLSGGMRQRVSIARAFVCNPDFILMDEPFSALDFFTREIMQKELMKIHKRSKCIILFVTHSVDEALMLGDKIIILEKGVIKSEYIIRDNELERNLMSEYFIDLKKRIINDLKII